MGKDKDKKKKAPKYPTISLLTPTFNRRPFIPMMLRCFELQTYPKDKIEWIIADDGTDKIGDLVSHIPQIKYHAFDEKMPLGKKRNFLNDQATGDIIVYIDDDDYYPPERIQHAVDWLRAYPKAMLVGSSKMFIYFNDLKQIYQFGPYGPQRCTAATMAYRRELLSQTRYNEEESMAEERQFMKNWTIPMEQMQSEKTILVLAHAHNSVDKRSMIGGRNVQLTSYKLEDFVSDEQIRHFITQEMDPLLAQYDVGKPSVKTDVMEQKAQKMAQIEEINRKIIADRELMRTLATMNTTTATSATTTSTSSSPDSAASNASGASGNSVHEKLFGDKVKELEVRLAVEKKRCETWKEKAEKLQKEKLDLLRELAIYRVTAKEQQQANGSVSSGSSSPDATIEIQPPTLTLLKKDENL